MGQLGGLVGWTSDDEFFGPAYFDADEQRVRPAAPHRYLHGGFEGTDTRFAICLPEAGFRDRVLLFLQGGMGGNEHQGMLLNGPAIAFENGAVYAESNQGHIGNDMSGLRGDNSILTWRASRQTALLAKRVAEEVYGRPVAFSYVYGGSGGGLRAIECLERCPDVWDGAVPFIINRNGLLTYNWSLLCWATQVLGDAVTLVVDATDAGGSGDPFAALDATQRDALATLYRGGFCRGAEAQIEPSPLWVMGLQLVERADPTFFSQFWEQAGYAGADRDPLVDRMLIEGEGTVAAVRTAAELAEAGGATDDLNAAVLGRAPAAMSYGIVLDGVSRPERLLGATLRFTSGAAAGRAVRCTGTVGETLTAMLDPVGFRDVAPGDSVAFDNRDLVAFSFHHRHLVSDVYPEMRQFVVDGRPIHPQRPIPFGMLPVPTGRFEGRMILIQHGSDKECWPSCARAYESSVRAARGGAADDVFRIWWLEHAAHLQPTTADGRQRVIQYGGEFAQAVRDLIAWVEDRAAPPPNTNASFSADNALQLPPTAQERGGIQPVVRLTANDNDHIEVAAGDTVALRVTATVPPAAGAVVDVAFDLDGTGTFSSTVDVVPAPSVDVSATWTAPAESGTYVLAVKVASQRDGDRAARLRWVTNLARLRVTVR